MEMETTQKNNIASITYELNAELRAFACRELNVDERFYEHSRSMSSVKEYSYYHKKLDIHLKRKYSSEMDRFAFGILLTYPQEKINTFQSWRDLKLNFGDVSKTVSNCETDFEIIDVFVSSGGDDGPSNYTCICGHHIQDIYKLRNKYTMTTFQVGSKCIERAGLVDSSTLKSHKKLMDAKIERQKEINEGKPIGYYEELRKNKKAEKERAKQLTIEERERVKQLKMETAQLNKLKNKKLACFKKCIMCNADKLFKLDDKLRICNVCVKNVPKVEKKKYVDLLNNPKHNIETECAWCEKFFTCWSKTFDKCLCNVCDITIKTVECDMCCSVFVNFQTSDDVTCDECDAKLKCCVGCANTFIPKRETNIRCNICQIRFDNNIAVIKCSDCCIDVEIKESEKKWKKKCAECFKNSQIYVDCSNCQEPFKRLSTDTWRTKCRECYHQG